MPVKLIRQSDGRFAEVLSNSLEVAWVTAEKIEKLTGKTFTDAELWKIEIVCFSEGTDIFFLNGTGDIVYASWYYGAAYSTVCPKRIEDLVELARKITLDVTSVCTEQEKETEYLQTLMR